MFEFVPCQFIQMIPYYGCCGHIRRFFRIELDKETFLKVLGSSADGVKGMYEVYGLLSIFIINARKFRKALYTFFQIAVFIQAFYGKLCGQLYFRLKFLGAYLGKKVFLKGLLRS